MLPAGCIRFLTIAQVLRIYETNIVRSRPTQPTYLESAVYSAQQHHNYGQDDHFELAGLLDEKIVLNHAYQDGNKRAALLATVMFLRMNGYQLQKKFIYSDELDGQLQNAQVAAATKQWHAEQLASFFRSVTSPASGMK